MSLQWATPSLIMTGLVATLVFVGLSLDKLVYNNHMIGLDVGYFGLIFVSINNMMPPKKDNSNPSPKWVNKLEQKVKKKLFLGNFLTKSNFNTFIRGSFQRNDRSCGM